MWAQIKRPVKRLPSIFIPLACALATSALGSPLAPPPQGCVGACVCARLANMASRLMKCIHLRAHPSPFQTKETSLSGCCLCMAAIRARTHTHIHARSKRKQTPDDGIMTTMPKPLIPVQTSLLVGSKPHSAVHLAINTSSRSSGQGFQLTSGFQTNLPKNHDILQTDGG